MTRNLPSLSLSRPPMRAAFAPVLLASVLACASHLSEEPLADEPGDPEPTYEFSAEPDAEAPAPEPEPEPEPESACLDLDFAPGAKSLAVPTYAAEPSSGACHRASKSIETEVRKDIRGLWSFQWQPHKLDVTFACDRLGPSAGVRELTLQAGSGHGQTLDLARLRRDEDGGDWDVLVLRRSGYRPDSRAPTYRGTIADADLRDALDYARAALRAEAVEPPRDGSGSYGFSSADFHAYVRLADARGRSRETAWVGYMSDDAQARWITASLASDSLWAVVDEAPLTETPPDADSREFFAQRFAEAQARDFYDAQYGWWVHARLVAMVADLGTLDFVPLLGARVCDADQRELDWTAHEGFVSLHALAGVEAPPLPDDTNAALRFIADWARRCVATCGG